MKSLVGIKFGYWTVISYSHRDKHAFWNCRCDCGTERIVQGPSLGKRSFSCGCLRKKLNRVIHITHGQSKTLLHGVWTRMKQRCENPKSSHYSDYGGRGILVCERWQTFDNFYEDMGSGWKSRLTIERIDNNGNYEPSNCRWATYKEQARNRRNSVWFDTEWGKITLAELIERTGLDKYTLDKKFKRIQVT